VVATKGAPEAILRLCRLDDLAMGNVLREVDKMAARGLRVIAVASASFAGPPWPDSPRAFSFAFLGLVGLADPLRPGVRESVEECGNAGIRVVMITGDYPATAKAIAEKAGLELAGGVVTGADLAQMTDADLRERVKSARIFARTLPDQKLRLVNALKANGEIVAMTGDGVNDAPSLRAAHIGIAMGGRGTDVAREAAAIVLLDDDFGSIVKAVRLGRRIHDNLRKAMNFLFAVHVPIAGLSLLPIVFDWPLLLMPLHIAFLELIIDPVVSIVFEAEGEERDLMRRPPRNVRAPLFSPATIALSIIQGAWVLLLTAGVLVEAHWRGIAEPRARALTFASLVLCDMVLIFANRSFSSSIVLTFLRPNFALWLALAAAAALLAITLAVPPVRALFAFAPLSASDLARLPVVALAAIGFFVLLKLIAGRRLPGWR
jgi:Ca2+-transporting ATPase